MKLMKKNNKTIVNIYNGYIASSDQGGGIKYIENLIKIQKKFYQKVYLLSLGTGSKKIIKINGTTVHFYPISRSHNWVTFSIKLFFFLRKNKIEFMNLNYHIHRIYFAPFIKSIKPKKIITTVHTRTFDVFEHNYQYLKGLIYFFIKIERIIMKYFIDDLTFAGIYAKDIYRFRHKNLKKKFWYLPPFFPFKKSNKSNFFKKENKKIILVVGRLSVGKRPLIALKLFSIALNKDKYVSNNFKLCFAGTGELLNELKDYIKVNQLDKHVLPIRKIKSSLMPQLYNSSHAVLFLSESEVNPFIIKESLASGKPIFTTNVGTAKYLITKENGVMIPVNDPLKNLNKFIKFLKKKYNRNKIINSSKKFIQKDENILNNNIQKLYK
jgi:L-malate glycosyltransferase